MKQVETAKRVGIWIRVSTEDQVKGESPETHERRARLYAESNRGTPYNRDVFGKVFSAEGVKARTWIGYCVVVSDCLCTKHLVVSCAIPS